MDKILANNFYRTTVAALVFTTSAFVYSQFNHYKDLREARLNSARRISQEIASRFSFFYNDIQNIAFNESVKQFDAKKSQAYFDFLTALIPQYDMIVLTNASGKLVAANTIGIEGEYLDPKKSRGIAFPIAEGGEASEEFKKGFLGSLVEDFRVNAGLEQVYGRPKIAMRFSAPIYDRDGSLKGYVSSFVDREWLAKEITRLREEFLGKEASVFELYLVNGEGQVIAGDANNSARPLEKLPFTVAGSNVTQKLEGAEVWQAIKSAATYFKHPLYIVSEFDHYNFLSEMQWSLIMKAPKAQAFAGIAKTAIWHFCAFLLFALGLKAIQMQAARRLEALWKEREEEGLVSFEEALELAQRKLELVDDEGNSDDSAA